MVTKQINIFMVCQLLCLKFLVSSLPINPDANIASANSHLRYMRSRLESLQTMLPAEFSDDLAGLQKALQAAYASTELAVKKQYLDNYNDSLRPQFQAYLQEKFDEQMLNAEINFEAWYLEELAKQAIDEQLASEIKSLLDEYKGVLFIGNINDKFDSFSQIQDKYSEKLMLFLNGETEAIVNIDLIFTRDYLEYLLGENITTDEYRDSVITALADVNAALERHDLIGKIKVMKTYDDIETDIGSFLYDNMHEFWFKKFHV